MLLGNELDMLRGDTQLEEPLHSKPNDPFNEFLNLIILGKYASVGSKIRRVIKYIEKHYTKTIRLKDAAVLINVHPNYLSRKFKKEVGLSFHEYIIRSRIKKAVSLLAYTDKSLKEISYEVGYARPEVFTRTFKRFVRFSPRKFRKRFRYG